MVQDSELTLDQQAKAAEMGAVAATTAPISKIERRITLASGITFELRPVAGLLIRQAVANIPKPKPPMHIDEARGGRETPNFDHPEYLAAVDIYNAATENAAMDVMLLRGTKLIEPLPDGIEGPQGNDWIEELDFLGVAVPDTRLGRYLAWLKYAVFSDPDELIRATRSIARMSGLSEEDVIEAMDSFRSDAQRDGNNGATPANALNGTGLRADAAGAGAGD